jgi:hypothetical protein
VKLTKASLDNLILIGGAILFLWILLLPRPGNMPWTYFDTVKYASSTLKGRTPYSDFAGEVVSFRALYNKTEPYPVLGPALKDLGIDWNVVHPNTHPPTAALFAAPVAFLPWPWASALWAWMMLGLMVLSFRFYGLSWKAALGSMPLTLLWPPTPFAIGQVTVLWLFFLAMAYYFRKRQLCLSGVSIGLASATKLWAGIVMVIFLMRRKWTAALGFLVIWIVMLAAVAILNSAAIPRYLVVSRQVSSGVIQRIDNQAPIVASYRYGGRVGVILIVLLFSLIVLLNRHYLYAWKTFPSTRAWMICSYFAVALLPTSHIYALIPLLPVIIFLLGERNIVTTVLALYAILIPAIYVQGGEQSVVPISSVSIAIGLGFILDVLPFKLFQKKWRFARLPPPGAQEPAREG